MISADFYPTERTFTNGEITKYFPLYNQSGSNYLEITSPETPDMYYLGWISWENTPSTFLMSESKNNTVNGTDYNTMTMTTTPSNFNVGYLGNFENTYTPAYQNAFNASYFDTQWKQSIGTDTNAFASRGFVNKFAVGAINYSYVTIGYVACIPNANVTTKYYATQNINAEDFEDWKESTQTLTFNNLGEVTIDNNVLNEQFYQDVDIDGTTYRIFIYTYAPFQDRPMNSNNDVDAYTWLTPFLNVTGSGTGAGEPSSGTELQILTAAQSATVYNYDSNYGGFDINWGSGYNKNTYRYFPNGGMGCSQVLHDEGWTYVIYPSGFSGKIEYSWASSYSTIGFYFDDDPTSNIYIYKDRNDFSCLGRMFTPIDIIHHMSLLPRWKAKSTDAATFGVQDGIYYPEVLPTNEFTGRLITGTRAELLEILRPWQIDADYWDSNDYTPDDLPPYTPPEPEPGSDEDEGSIPLNTPGALGATNAFTTRYVLNTTQIRTIGQQLWSTIGDGNELTWQNFFLTLSGSDKIDYSLTLSEVISYFVSLKYFPFSLNSVSSTTGEAGIRVGTGASLISAGTTTKTLNDSIVQLNGGRCTIPGKWNNYLDLEPYTTASLYVPYCGTMELPMSVIAGETIGITYLVDMTTGAMTAAIMKYSGSGAYFPIAVMNGSCGFDILMTGTNGNSQMTNAITNLASKSTQWVGQTLQSGLTGLMGGVSGRDASGMGALSGMANTVMGIGQDMIQQNIQMPKLYATAPMTSGSSSSLSSLILPQTAYIQIRRHNPYRLSGSSSYQDELGLIGCRSAYQGLISSANGMGFVKCQNPNLAEVADAGATEAEINMIKSLLSDGIFT